MRIINIFIVLFFIVGCNHKKVDIQVNKLNGNRIYYSIINYSDDDIQFLKPMEYLCYSDSLILTKKYAILALGENTDSGFFTINGGGTMPDFENSNAIKGYLGRIDKYKNLSNYKVITIKEGQSYTDSLLIPNSIDSPCGVYPKINEKTVLNLSGGEANFNLNSRHILEVPQFGRLNPDNILNE